MINGKEGRLVWDNNAPHESLRSACFANFWHPVLERRVRLELKFVRSTTTSDYKQGCAQVADIRSRGHHVICGSEEHSYLVAGEVDDEYFVWDPDGSASATAIEDNIRGSVTLQNVFNFYPAKLIEFWEYAVTISG